MATRFSLKHALAAWRRPFEHHTHISKEDLEELEGTLLERMHHLQNEGYSEEEAFHRAVKRAGSFGKAGTEYGKVYWGKVQREGRMASELQWRLSLLKNYARIAVRNLRKQLGYTLINTTGLAVGLACVILIGLYVRFELSYDRFHEKADHIFRIAREDPGSSFLGKSGYAVTPAPLVDALLDEFPEVEFATQVEPSRVILSKGSERFYENGLAATTQFFEVFSFDLVHGQKEDALRTPETIVFTETLARKYFGDTNPVGETLAYKQGRDSGVLTVTGVVADPPPNSHIGFDYLISMSTSSTFRFLLRKNEWDSNNYRTYTSLVPGSDVAAFEAKLTALAKERLSPLAYYQEHPDRIAHYFPQALTSIHLHSNLNFELGQNGSSLYVSLFSVIGLLILLLACINYTNLSTARALVRAREVGIRKVVGAYRRQLMAQFIGEALILVAMALVGAIALAYTVLPTFNALVGREIVLGWEAYQAFWLAVLAGGLAIGLVTGLYPAFVLSAFKPTAVLAGGRGLPSSGRPWLRNSLVVAQFAITTTLVVGTVVVYLQLDYVRHTETGLDREHVISISIPDRATRAQYGTLKQGLLQHPQVLQVSGTRFSPTYMLGQTTTDTWEGAEEGQQLSVYQNPVLPGFTDVFGLELVAGRAFSEEATGSSRVELIINETLVRQLGWDDPIGKRFSLQGMDGEVVGVVKDFHFQPFQQAIAPLVLYPSRTWFSSVLVKTRPEGGREALAHIEATLTALAPDYPFEYEFVDDAYQSMYGTEARLGRVFGYFSGIALVIACLGLLGLAAFAAAQRTKEIGIRKALGASAIDILVLLSRDFTRLVVFALLIGLPVAYAGAAQWLQEFAYAISLNGWTFMLVAAAILGVAWLTVGYQAIRGAHINPAHTLRQT